MQVKNILKLLVIFFFTLIGILESRPKDYPITPVPFTNVKVLDEFWAPRLKINKEVTIPIAFKMAEETGRIANFKIAGKLMKGKFRTQYPFDDSDIYKNIEAASYSLQIMPDSVLEAYVDKLITYIAAAQEPDGYLYTCRTIDPLHPHEWSGLKRWEREDELSHELYDAGHMYESAVAYYLATGKRTFLNIALRNADLVEREFGWGKIEKAPGHQVIEMGLVKLYRVTGDERYLRLAKFFIDVRGQRPELGD
ncbi:MAG: beta-L-arabinofuranosidase domain-containing protein, partial [Bacteroidota bacterium]